MPFASLRGYRPGWLRGDCLAGLTVWAVLVPESLAYASIAGVSPVVGLYAAPGALILYAALGSSRHLITGPMAATAALSEAAVGDLAAANAGRFAALTTTLAITMGVLALLAGLARLGFVANFISEPVLKGFIIGLALTIIIGQVPKLFGIPKGADDFFQQLWHVSPGSARPSGATWCSASSRWRSCWRCAGSHPPCPPPWWPSPSASSPCTRLTSSTTG